MKYLIIPYILCGLLLLVGCATKMQTVNPNHLAWSSKTMGYATSGIDVSVVMNKHGLIILSVDGEAVNFKENWCIEIVKYIPHPEQE